MNNPNVAAVQMAKKAHKLKTKVKKICQQMDEKRLGKIKTDVFFSILKITNIRINKETEIDLKKLFEDQGEISYKDALGRIAVNLEENKPLNNDWVLRSTQSSMRSSLFTSASNRRPVVMQNEFVKERHTSPVNLTHIPEIKKDDEISVKLHGDLASEYNPYPKAGSENRLFNRSARSSLSRHKRGITPAPLVPLKLIKPLKVIHETKYNIITNRDKNESAPVGPKITTQAERDYQDYTKSEFSFEYTKTKGNKKFSVHRIAKKYMDFYNKKKEREIPHFIKELLSDEQKLLNALEDMYSVKTAFDEKELCLLEDGIFDTILKNFELLDSNNTKKVH